MNGAANVSAIRLRSLTGVGAVRRVRPRNSPPCSPCWNAAVETVLRPCLVRTKKLPYANLKSAIVLFDGGSMPVTADNGWLQLFTAALGGGLTVKAVDIIYQEVRRRLDKTQTVTKFLDDHLDPLLKAADEVVGKLHSLATEDFKTLAGRQISLNPITDNDFGSLLYLFSHFWARIEIIRQEGLSIANLERPAWRDAPKLPCVPGIPKSSKSLIEFPNEQSASC